MGLFLGACFIMKEGILTPTDMNDESNLRLYSELFLFKNDRSRTEYCGRILSIRYEEL